MQIGFKMVHFSEVSSNLKTRLWLCVLELLNISYWVYYEDVAMLL